MPDVERFFALFADNVHRQGTPALPRRYFALLRETFGDDCRVLTVLDAAGRAGVERAHVLLAGRSAALLRRRRGGGARARGERLQVLGAHARRLRARATGCSTTAAASAAPARSISRRTGASSRSRCTTSTCWSRGKRVPEVNPLNPKYRLFINAVAAHAAAARQPDRPAHREEPGLVRHEDGAHAIPPNCWRRPGPPRGWTTRAIAGGDRRGALILWQLAWYARHASGRSVAIWKQLGYIRARLPDPADQRSG